MHLTRGVGVLIAFTALEAGGCAQLAETMLGDVRCEVPNLPFQPNARNRLNDAALVKLYSGATARHTIHWLNKAGSLGYSRYEFEYRNDGSWRMIKFENAQKPEGPWTTALSMAASGQFAWGSSENGTWTAENNQLCHASNRLNARSCNTVHRERGRYVAHVTSPTPRPGCEKFQVALSPR